MCMFYAAHVFWTSVDAYHGPRYLGMLHVCFASPSHESLFFSLLLYTPPFTRFASPPHESPTAEVCASSRRARVRLPASRSRCHTEVPQSSLDESQPYSRVLVGCSWDLSQDTLPCPNKGIEFSYVCPNPPTCARSTCVLPHLAPRASPGSPPRP